MMQLEQPQEQFRPTIRLIAMTILQQLMAGVNHASVGYLTAITKAQVEGVLNGNNNNNTGMMYLQY